MSDTVLLAIIGVLGGLATLYLKSLIDAKAKAAEARNQALEIKIDGRLTDLLDVTKKLAEAQGREDGVKQEKADEKGRQDQVPKIIATDEGGKTSVIKENLDQAKAKIDIAKKKLDK